MNTFKQIVTDYQHSIHDGKIRLDDILIAFKESGFIQLKVVKQISILRTLAEALLKKVSRELMKSNRVITTLTYCDRFVLGTVGKISRRAGASAVFGLMKKTTSAPSTE